MIRGTNTSVPSQSKFALTSFEAQGQSSMSSVVLSRQKGPLDIAIVDPQTEFDSVAMADTARRTAKCRRALNPKPKKPPKP